MSTAVDVVGLGRDFGGKRHQTVVTALGSVDLSIPDGEVHGLLGPNGAGKTTLCKILSTVLLPTRGRAQICGHDVVTETLAVRRLVGIVFGGERGLYGRLTARANLDFWARLYGLSGSEARARVGELLDRLGLAERADDKVETFSRGMKQRLHLARGLMGDPRVLLLDEPTTGMDPVAATEFRSLVADLRSEGRTVLLTTHDMAEAEALCDRVSLIDNGALIATERPATLGTWITRFARVVAHAIPTHRLEDVVAAVEALDGVSAIERLSPTAIRVDTTLDGAAPAAVQELLRLGITEVAASRPDLSEVYLHVFGHRGMRVDR